MISPTPIPASELTDSASNLAAESAVSRAPVTTIPLRDEDLLDAEIEALAAEEKRLAARARERAEREARARAEAQKEAHEKQELRDSLSSAKERSVNEAKAILRELAKARAEERAAAEESIRKAREAQERDSQPQLAGKEGNEVQTVPPARSSWFSGLKVGKIWYFTNEGERRGPVTFAELRTMAANSVLNPRCDLVWKKGMSDWEQSGLVDGLFERSAVRREVSARPVVQAPPVASLRSSALAETLASKDLRWPGSGRFMLLLGCVLIAVFWKPALSFASPWLIGWFGDVLMGKLLPWAPYVPPLVWVHLVLNRLANLGMSRWWALAVVVPLLNLWVAFRCLVCPAGYAYHKRMDAAGTAVLASAGLLVTGAGFMVTKHPDMIATDKLRTGIQNLILGAGKFAGSRF